MQVTKVEVVRNKDPIPLSLPWLSAWREPNGEPVTSVNYGFYRVHTDEGIVGIGPYSGGNPSLVDGIDPFLVGAFWEAHLSGRRAGMSGRGAAGFEIALWDIIGKAAGLPIYKLLGARKDRIPVYAATSRLLPAEELAQEVLALVEIGFKAVKLRLHRPDPRDDLRVVEAVRKAAGDDLPSWSTAIRTTPPGLPLLVAADSAQDGPRAARAGRLHAGRAAAQRQDVEGLTEIAAEVDMLVAGGEHSPTVYDFKQHILQGAYDVLQPDVILGGNIGITGIRKVGRSWPTILGARSSRTSRQCRSLSALYGRHAARHGHRRQLPDGRVSLRSTDPDPRDNQAIVHEPLPVEPDGTRPDPGQTRTGHRIGSSG